LIKPASRVGFFSSGLQNLEANFLHRMTVAVQMRLQGWQHLAQFGCSGIGADQ
jgi:hypothetical protein